MKKGHQMAVSATISLLFFVFPARPAVCGWLGGGPSSYDECILEAMKGVTSDIAARAIAASCRNKFPTEKVDDALVPQDVLLSLDGRAKKEGRFFSGSIYNGSGGWVISQVTIALTPKGADKDQMKQRGYKVDLMIAPLSSERFSFDCTPDEGSDVEWNIVAAHGHKETK